MVSPIPKHLRRIDEYAAIPSNMMDHVVDLTVTRPPRNNTDDIGVHRAKYAPGLATALVALAGTDDIGDPMAGTGTLARETGLPMALNDIDAKMLRFLTPLAASGCEITCRPATEITWRRKVCIFSPPYYPKADRCRPCAHNDAKRGPIVGFRDAYLGADHPQFIGNPSGKDAILHYRRQMTDVYRHLRSVCKRMIVVTKNWTRLGVEMRLDLDTVLMAQTVGWHLEVRHGWRPPPSLWSRFNAARGGGVTVEDVLIFAR